MHNTRGMGLANVLVARHSGVEQFDTALGGLGSCPFAPGASSNVCSKDAVHMFEAMGVTTGVDLDAPNLRTHYTLAPTGRFAIGTADTYS